MLLEAQHNLSEAESRAPSDARRFPRQLVERPWSLSNERRFDLQPDSDRSEYFTISDAGIVKYFAWEERQFDTALATSIAPDLLTIGVAVAEKVCAPKELSPVTQEMLRLYDQLHAFKEDEEFAVRGFSSAGPYNVWLDSIKDVADRAGFAPYNEVGMLPGDLMMLGMDYMRLARGGSDILDSINAKERTLQAGLALATCQGQ